MLPGPEADARQAGPREAAGRQRRLPGPEPQPEGRYSIEYTKTY